MRFSVSTLQKCRHSINGQIGVIATAPDGDGVAFLDAQQQQFQRRACTGLLNPGRQFNLCIVSFGDSNDFRNWTGMKSATDTNGRLALKPCLSGGFTLAHGLMYSGCLASQNIGDFLDFLIPPNPGQEGQSHDCRFWQVGWQWRCGHDEIDTVYKAGNFCHLALAGLDLDAAC
ncbi:hypothetical protein AZF01_07435 [Martelella sp. AD-3]|nr:hypothetical protein AZF01_07435 [Martelella sp. AD-3]